MRTKRFLSLALVCLLAFVAAVPFSSATANGNTKKLRDAVTASGIMEHLQAFQAIADANGGTRAAGTSGYDSSAEYVYEKLTAAGYDVMYQPFPFNFFQELGPAQLRQVAPNTVTYDEALTYTYSGNGNVTANVQAVDINLTGDRASTSGCEDSDFAGFTAGNIALIQRGTCTFEEKAANAQEAGAVGVVIFNQGNSPTRVDAFAGTLGRPFTIPVVGISFTLGAQLAGIPGLVLNIVTSTISEERITNNVIAETRKGRDDQVVVVGAHLDSVAEGPGINDNGSGSGTILEIALQMARLNINPKNTVRFAFWSAEELGLLGSEYYVSQLTEQEIANIALNLNFDMVASPNYVRFVYDGNNSLGEGAEGPEGSAFIEDLFVDYFNRVGLSSDPTPFSGRSDYGPFIDVGIPAGGLFTGAEGTKTEEQEAEYGGVAGEAYDPCYHAACDTLHQELDGELAALYAQLHAEYPLVGNVNLKALDEMSDAAAHVVEYFATTPMPFKERGKSGEAPAKGQFKDAHHHDEAE